MRDAVAAELFEEKSLWAIYKQCLLRLPKSRFNTIATCMIWLFLLCDCIYFPDRYVSRVALVRSVAELGLGYGTTILGFLIAGFTIFATLSKPELFGRMQQLIHRESGLSYLKVNLFAFMEVFILYVFFLVFCLVIKLIGGAGGFLSAIFSYSFSHPVGGYYLSREWFSNIAFNIFGTLAFYCLLALKSFVFNNYQAVLTSIVWSLNPIKKARCRLRPFVKAPKYRCTRKFKK